MAGDLLHARRPERTIDVIKSLENPPDEETKAHLAIKSNMISHFKNQPALMYCKEAMLLSAVADNQEFNDLIAGFASAITTGTADEKPLDRDLLHYFAGFLRWGQHAIPPSEQIFGAFLNALSKYLTSSNNESRLRDSYLLTRAIGTILDAMVDCKVEGLDRVQLHGPLEEKLRGLEDHDEPRLAQAAQYALQALHRVPDNEGPWEEALRYGGITINIVIQLSGAVAKLDLGQLIDAGPDLLKLISRFGEALKGGKEIWDTRQNFQDLLNGMRGVSEKRGWYDTLRMTDLFIRLEAYDGLKEFISPFKGKPLRCFAKREFWCGLYSQLEQQWFAHVPSRDRIERFLDWTLELPVMKKFCKECDFTRAWVTLVAESAQRPNWKAALPPKRKGMLSRLRRSKEAQPQLKSIFGATQTRDSRQESHGDSPLLQNAMQTCGDAQLFYADAIIAQYYTEGKLLHVRRISGDDVPIENCYINLSLIEDLAERDTKINQVGMSLKERLKAETPQPEKQIDLKDLFMQRKLRDGSSGQPTRILIRGRAGVGKTTLCKKIIHAFLHHGLWRSKYDRIIWIPLRNLKNYQTFELFIEQEVFGKIPYSKPLWERLQNELCDFQDCRSLFILDGLDEIAGLPEKIDLFQYLLNRQDVIITSRPHAVFPSRLKGYDLEIETVGFLDDQIGHYVDRVCSKADGLQIKDFIGGHWMMQGLMRIPIQLDALCFAWEEGIQRVRPLTTMTALYQAIEIKLWKKDIPRLDPSVGHKVVKCHNRPQIALQIPGVIEFIQYIAFMGLYSNITEFTFSVREEIYQKFPNMTDRILDEVSFMRSSDASSSPRDQDYYFLHLTFQEYFAAQYFLQSWKEGTEVLTFDLSSGNFISISTEDFIGREKYNGRYNIMWRFVCGSMSNKDPDLMRLFAQIEMKPRDLLGPVHLRFLLPEGFFSRALEEGDSSQQIKALGAIESRSHISDKLSRQVWGIFKSDVFSPTRAMAAGVIGRFPNFTSNELLSTLSDPDDLVKRRIVPSLDERNVSETILHAAVDVLPLFEGRHEGFESRYFERTKLPQSVVTKLIAQYHQQTTLFDRHRTLHILSVQEFLDVPDIKDILVQAFDDPQKFIRRTALLAFVKNPSDLSPSDCHKLLSRLPLEPELFNLNHIVTLLQSQTIQPKGVLECLWQTFEMPNSGFEFHTIWSACDILRDSGLWHADELTTRFENSLHKDEFAIVVTSYAFDRNSILPDVFLSHCVSILERYIPGELSSGERELLKEVINALEDCPSLSCYVVRVVWHLFKQGKAVKPASELLRHQISLSDDVLSEMECNLEEQQDMEIRFLVLCILVPRVEFDTIAESAILALLHHSDQGDEDQTNGAEALLEALIAQPILPSWASERLAPLLLSTKFGVVYSARELLRKHANFEQILPRLDAVLWEKLFQHFLTESCERSTITCSIQGQYLHVVLPERSWRVCVQQPEQRQKLQSALGLNDIEQTEGFAELFEEED
ncbi:uncharacterized protein N7506_012220 [Penicillium brevicompactum]|uniref:uncharacterized protein n=1 Tax=Penicillium brevicompactum TaxID=5074 RepID=UPI0025405ECE|nr:uncharacterized protein N7506_012220 [Penicillium brevicompactum]KAJ5319516.1 hypothetical protein N7506_012220 [Penicillium brevicompactum]